MVSMLSLMPFLEAAADDVGEAPFGDVGNVIARADQAAPADVDAGRRQLGLGVEPVDQLVVEPARDEVALGRVDEAEIEDVDEQDLPIELHRGEQAPPVYLLGFLEDGVGDVGAVIAVAVLEEELGEDE